MGWRTGRRTSFPRDSQSHSSHSACYLFTPPSFPEQGLGRWQQPQLLEAAEPFAEHVLGVHALVKPCLPQLDRADQHGRGRLLSTVSKNKISEDEGLTNELA